MKQLVLLFSLMCILLVSNKTEANITPLDNDFTKTEKEYISSNTFTFGIIVDNYPFTFKEKGKHYGFSYDYINLLINKSGLKVKFEMNNWSSTLNKFKNKQIDLIDFISYKKSREVFVNFSKPYFEIPSAVFARKGEFNNYTGLESLKGKKVAITKGAYYYDYVNNLKLFQLVPFTHSRDKIKALVFGKVDAVFHNLVNAQGYIKSAGYANITILEELDSSIVKKEDVRIGVKKEDKTLFSIINKSTEAVTVEEKEQLYNKWFAARVESKTSNSNIDLEDIEKKYLLKKKHITMCVNPDWMPFEKIENGKHIGLASDYIKIVENNIGVPFKLLITKNWADSLQKAKNRQCDILSLVMGAAKKNKYMNVTKPYFSLPLVIATRNEAIFIADIDSIKDNKVGLLKGHAFTKKLKTKYRNLNFVEVDTISDGLEKVFSRDLHGYIGDIASVSYNIQQNYIGKLKIAGKFDDKLGAGIAIRNDDKILLSIMEKAVDNISTTEDRSIYNKWIPLTYEIKQDYTLIIEIIAGLIVIILLITYWNRKISKANKLLEEAKKEIEKQNIELEKIAVTDKLTGAFNRGKIDSILENEINRSERFEYIFGIAVLDIDHFKSVNDTYGHQVGDKIIIEVVQILNSHIRKTDFVGRWGGEEFIVICPQSDKAGVMKLIEKIRIAIDAFDFSEVGNKTASFGVTMYSSGDSIDSMIKRADDALYEAKKSGRNKVVFGTAKPHPKGASCGAQSGI